MGESSPVIAPAKSTVTTPPKFNVVMHNDDYTTMEFVVDVLKNDFQHPHEHAMALMLKIHEQGRAIAGSYSREIAESKALKVIQKARAQGHPLRLTVEQGS